MIIIIKGKTKESARRQQKTLISILGEYTCGKRGVVVGELYFVVLYQKLV